MDLKNYAVFVDSRAKPGVDILAQMTPEKAELGHMAHGLATEAGELCDALKRHVDYNKPLDVENVIEEAGDFLFYLQRLLNIVGSSIPEVITWNEQKLSVRYKEKYTDAEASARADKATPGPIPCDHVWYKQHDSAGLLWKCSKCSDTRPVI